MPKSTEIFCTYLHKLGFVFCVLTSGLILNSCQASPTNAEAKPFNSPQIISFDSSPTSRGGIPTVEYYFGEVDQLDPSLNDEEQAADDGYKANEDYLIGRKHTFFLYNHGTEAVTIEDAHTEDPSLDARVPEGDKFLAFPQTIEPGGKLPVVVAFDWRFVAAGKYWGTINFLSKPKRKTVARIQVTAQVNGPIVYRPESLDFGKVVVGSHSTRVCKLSINRRLTENLIPGDTLTLESTNKDIEVSFANPLSRPDVQIKGNTMLFKYPKNNGFNNQLQKDIQCDLVVRVARGARIGAVRSSISLVSGAAPNLIVLNVSMPVTATVTGPRKNFSTQRRRKKSLSVVTMPKRFVSET